METNRASIYPQGFADFLNFLRGMETVRWRDRCSIKGFFLNFLRGMET